jgi:drug/metabolite transporter (DMT)-like permease
MSSLSIVHRSPGRLRLRLSDWNQAPSWQTHLIQRLLALPDIIQARYNPWAKALIVHHCPSATETALCQQIDQQIAWTIAHQAAWETLALPQANTALVQGNHTHQMDLADQADQADGVWRGVGWVLLATGTYASMQALIRLISGQVHPFQTAFLSNVLGVGLLLPWIGPHTLATDRLPDHGWRALLDAAASLLLFSGLSLVPLAQVNALGFTTPLFAIFGASLWFGETLPSQSGLALLLGIAGTTLVVAQSGLGGVGLGSFLVLGGSAAFAGVLLLLKHLSTTESSLTCILYNALLLIPLTALPGLAVWTWPSGLEWIILTLIAGAAIGGQVFMAEALKSADTTAVLPADFAQLVWAILLGYLFFQELPTLTTTLGAGLIFAGVLYAATAQPDQDRREHEQIPQLFPQLFPQLLGS